MKTVDFEIYPFVNEGGTLELPDSVDAEDLGAVLGYVENNLSAVPLHEIYRDYAGAEIHLVSVDDSDTSPESSRLVVANIDAEKIKRTEQILVDNGIEPDEAANVLQAVGYALLDTGLYEDWGRPREEADVS